MPTHSSENRPPLPHRKSEEKVSRKAMVQKSLDEKKQSPPASKGKELAAGASKEKQAVKKGKPAGKEVMGKPESESELEDTLKGRSWWMNVFGYV